MRPNHRLTADELLVAQVRRAQERRQIQVQPEEEAVSIELIAWVVVAGIAWTFCLLIWWMG